MKHTLLKTSCTTVAELSKIPWQEKRFDISIDFLSHSVCHVICRALMGFPVYNGYFHFDHLTFSSV